MATFGAEDIEKMCHESARALGSPTLRDQQLQVITSFIKMFLLFCQPGMAKAYAMHFCY